MGGETKPGTPKASREEFKMTFAWSTFPFIGQSGRTLGWLRPFGGSAHAR